MEKYSIQIDTLIKICYDCKSKAVIIIEKNITVQLVDYTNQQKD
tara:strand:+ start:473 stop:604 length:132 start_codon:yes stop_codon:yes gene_type:complete